ncbi:MAG: energy transducer TonB [Pseudomonadota bacterium]
MKQILMTATAVAFCIVPTVSAQTNTPVDGIPYTITLDGDRYPLSTQSIEYPYTAGRLGISGDCRLSVHVDTDNSIAGMTIESCSDERFRDTSRRFINAQSFEGSMGSDLKSYPLTISWEIGATDKELIIASNR